MLAGDDRAGAVTGERCASAGEGRDGALGAVLGGGQQPERPPVVVVEVLVVGVLEAGPVVGDALDVGAQARPAREAVLAGDHELGGAELQRRLRPRMVRADAGDGSGRAGPMGACELLGLLAQLLQAGSGGKRCGHQTASSPVRPCPLSSGGKKETAARLSLPPGWARPFPRTGRGPGRARGAYRCGAGRPGPEGRCGGPPVHEARRLQPECNPAAARMRARRSPLGRMDQPEEGA